MFDIGGLELLVIAVVALVVIGPKDLPVAIRTVRQWMSRARDLAREFQGGLDEIARDAKLDEVKREIDRATRPDLAGDFKKEIENTIDPGGKMAESLKIDRDWYSPDGIADGERTAKPAEVSTNSDQSTQTDSSRPRVEPVASEPQPVRREG